jgi:hypothetical protein
MVRLPEVHYLEIPLLPLAFQSLASCSALLFLLSQNESGASPGKVLWTYFSELY